MDNGRNFTVGFFQVKAWVLASEKNKLNHESILKAYTYIDFTQEQTDNVANYLDLFPDITNSYSPICPVMNFPTLVRNDLPDVLFENLIFDNNLRSFPTSISQLNSIINNNSEKVELRYLIYIINSLIEYIENEKLELNVFLLVDTYSPGIIEGNEIFDDEEWICDIYYKAAFPFCIRTPSIAFKNPKFNNSIIGSFSKFTWLQKLIENSHT